jgi:hypothetical protein
MLDVVDSEIAGRSPARPSARPDENEVMNLFVVDQQAS